MLVYWRNEKNERDGHGRGRDERVVTALFGEADITYLKFLFISFIVRTHEPSQQRSSPKTMVVGFPSDRSQRILADVLSKVRPLGSCGRRIAVAGG